MRRATVAVRRRESVAVLPEVFADFLLRRQHVHPARAGEGSSAPSSRCSSNCKASRRRRRCGRRDPAAAVKDYRPAWLDEVLRGETGSGGPKRAAARSRESPSSRVSFRSVAPRMSRPRTLPAPRSPVLDLLDRHGASFTVDLARLSGLEPSQVRESAPGFVASRAGDQRPIRPGASRGPTRRCEALSEAGAARRASLGRRPRGTAGDRGRARGAMVAAAGRGADAEAGCLRWAEVLLERYGVLTREVVALSRRRPPWAELAPLLRGRNGGERYAGVISSKGFRACNMPPERGRFRAAGSCDRRYASRPASTAIRGIAEAPRRPRWSAPPIPPTFTGRVLRWTSSCWKGVSRGCRAAAGITWSCATAGRC